MWFGLTPPPPVMVKDHIFTFFLGPFPKSRITNIYFFDILSQNTPNAAMCIGLTNTCRGRVGGVQHITVQYSTIQYNFLWDVFKGLVKAKIQQFNFKS